MTFQITITGHADNAAGEDLMLHAATDAVRKMFDTGQVYSASASTSHHGTVNLVDAANNKNEDERPDTEDWTMRNEDGSVDNPNAEPERDKLTGGV